MEKPCQRGYDCPWGRKVSEAKVICSMPRCVLTDDADDDRFKYFDRMMKSANTYDRRGGRVRSRHTNGGG